MSIDDAPTGGKFAEGASCLIAAAATMGRMVVPATAEEEEGVGAGKIWAPTWVGWIIRMLGADVLLAGNRRSNVPFWKYCAAVGHPQCYNSRRRKPY